MIRVSPLPLWSFVSILFSIPILAGMTWRDIEDSEFASATFVPGDFYSVQLGPNSAVLDLDFESDARYLLIVNSLAPAEIEQTIALTAEPIAEVQSLPIRRVPTFRPHRPRGESATTASAEAATRSVRAARSRSSLCAANVGPQCSTDDCGRGVDGLAQAEPAAREFYLHVTDGSLEDPRQYVCVSARVIAEGRQVRVYWDEQASASARQQETADEIVRLLEEDIIPGFREMLGQFRDIDGDGKFSVLLTPWLDKLQGGRTSLGGFVRGSDFSLKLKTPFSNHCDMMYLNTNLGPGPHLKVLLAHEFAHAVCFSERSPTSGRSRWLPNEEDWLNEAIAHVAESRQGGHWSNLDYRISRFLNAPHRSPLVIPDYYRAGLWRDHGCRGATYLFLQWCVDQHGDELLKRLVQASFRGTQNLERATGTTFEELYRHWSIALLAASLPEAIPAGNAPMSSSESPPPQNPAFPLPASLSLNLCGRMSQYGLIGPRRLEWNVDGRRQSIELAGTATAFLELRSSAGQGVRRIRIEGGQRAGLQVTILKCPQEWQRVDLTVRRLSITETAAIPCDQPGARLLEVQIAGPTTNGLTLDMLACEQVGQEERQQSVCFTADELVRLRNASAGADDGTSENVIRLILPISPQWADEALILKLAATDAQGRRVVSWRDLPAHDTELITASRLSAQ
jgi:hypothetical protein